jgi:vacuolar-type H+-ATPase subunit H
MNQTGALPPPERRVTPESLRTMTFPRAPLTRRGYSEQPVHDVLRRCAAALTVLMEENDRLRTDMQRHRDWIRANNIGDGKSPTGVPTVDAVLQQARAQQSAEQTVFAAREQARTMLRAARVQAEAILQELREHGGQAGDESQEETERLISYLRQIAQSLTVTADQYATKTAPPPPAHMPAQSAPQDMAQGHPASPAPAPAPAPASQHGV